MTSTILSKGLNKISIGLNNQHSPTDNDYIKYLDYEELENKFQINKYYPKFIHNYEVSTPRIKDLIANKPIYANANKHIKKWKNPGSKHVVSTTIDLETGKVEITKRKTEKDHEWEQVNRPKANDQERKGPRREHTQEWQNSRVNHRQERKALMTKQLQDRLRNQSQHGQQQNDFLVFKNPFESNESTLVETEDSKRPQKRNNSIANKFINFVKGTSDSPDNSQSSSLDYPLKTSRSFDQTKSAMTNNRSKKNRILKLKLNDRNNRRLSEQIGKYYILH